MPQRIELTQDDLITGLREYCRLAPAFTNFYRRIESKSHPEDAKLLQTLQTVIQNADYQNSIYADENFDLYLLYLIEHKKIPFWQGITQYTYWLLLIEFVDSKQNYFARRPKNPETVKVVSLDTVMEGDAATYAMLIYHDFSSKLKENKFDQLPYEKFQAIINSLPVSDRVAFQVDISAEYSVDEYSREIQIKEIMRDAINYSTIVRLVSNNPAGFVVLVPSIALTQAIYAELAPFPIQMKPIMGVVGLEVLREQFHKVHLHPLALCSPRVKHNLLNPHNVVPSALFPWIHDTSHAFVGSIMDASMRDVLHGAIIPWFKTGVLEACRVPVEKVALICDEMADMNFASAQLDRTAEPFNQLIKYISSIYDNVDLKPLYFLYVNQMSADRFNKLGEGNLSKDAYLYFLGKEKQRLQSLAPESLEAQFFSSWYQTVYAEFSQIKERVPILKAIEALNNGLTFNPHRHFEVDHFECADILAALTLYLDVPAESTALAEEKLWGGFQYCQKTLLMLMTDANLKYFHPHLPMGRGQAQQLKQMLAHYMENAPVETAQAAYASANLTFFEKKPSSPILRAVQRAADDADSVASEYPIDPLDSSLNSRYSSARMTTGT